jgi:hypothetical protein
MARDAAGRSLVAILVAHVVLPSSSGVEARPRSPARRSGRRFSIAADRALGCKAIFPASPAMTAPCRLTNLWKPASVALALLAATIYAGLAVHEFSRRTRLGEERRARADAGRAFVDDEAMLGTIWAHEHHPHDASWCPDYSPSFLKGCADAIVVGLAPPAFVRR